MSYAYGMVAPSAATMTSPDRLNRLPAAQATLIRLGGQTKSPPPTEGPPPEEAKWAPSNVLIREDPAPHHTDGGGGSDDVKLYVMYGLVAIAVVGIGWYFVSKRGA